MLCPVLFQNLQSEYPGYVEDEDRNLSHTELLQAICERQRDDIVRAHVRIVQTEYKLYRASAMIENLTDTLQRTQAPIYIGGR